MKMCTTAKLHLGISLVMEVIMRVTQEEFLQTECCLIIAREDRSGQWVGGVNGDAPHLC